MLQLRLQISAASIDSIENLLFGCGAVSVALEDGACNPILEPKIGDHPLWPTVYVRALFADQDAILLANKALENDPTVCAQVQLDQIDEYGWQEKFQQQFGAKQYGPRLWVYPSWQDNPDPQAISIQLDPGLAFGTGQHPTTDLCLQWLANTTLTGNTLIDFGCGSGILTMAACKLGAAHVYAIDIDPQALLATKNNCALNDINSEQITTGEIGVLQDIRADITVANILAGPILALRDTFTNHLVESGHLLLSGILTTQTQTILDHYNEQFECLHQAKLEDWACITLKRIPQAKYL